MVAIDAFGLGCWLAMSASFCVWRRAVSFSAASMTVIGAFIVSCATSGAQHLVGCVATTIGLTAYWLGLLLMRAMLARSVSLQLLIASANGRDADFDGSLAARLDDALTYRLASCDRGRYELSAFGRAVARCVRVAYRATGSPE